MKQQKQPNLNPCPECGKYVTLFCDNEFHNPQKAMDRALYKQLKPLEDKEENKPKKTETYDLVDLFFGLGLGLMFYDFSIGVVIIGLVVLIAIIQNSNRRYNRS